MDLGRENGSPLHARDTQGMPTNRNEVRIWPETFFRCYRSLNQRQLHSNDSPVADSLLPWSRPGVEANVTSRAGCEFESRPGKFGKSSFEECRPDQLKPRFLLLRIRTLRGSQAERANVESLVIGRPTMSPAGDFWLHHNITQVNNIINNYCNFLIQSEEKPFRTRVNYPANRPLTLILAHF